jgi:hypothetical protein
MPKRNGPAALACIAMLSLGTAALAAEVVLLADGTVIIGSLVDAEGSQLSYESFGSVRKIDSSKVIETSKELSALSGRSFDVVLADKSVFTGSLADYDPEIGLFVDLSIGTLTLPASGVARIEDPVQRRLWVGSDFSLRASAVYYWPLGSESFSPSIAAGLSAEARLPYRGLTLGLATEWSPLNYEDSSEVEYSLYSAVARLGYRYLGWRSSRGALAFLTPFASVGAGFTYIGIKDSRPGANSPSSGGMAPRLAAELGVEFLPSRGISVRALCRPDLVLQAGGSFSTLGAGLSAAWEIQ